MSKIIIVGITGGTGSGKSTIASLLCQTSYPEKSIIIDQDSYYKDRSHLCLLDREKCNFDEPDAVDFDLLFDHLTRLRSGLPIDKPVYCFKEHIRKKETMVVFPKQIVFVDGMLILCNSEVRNFFDVKVFVDAPADIRFIRRVHRDIKERGRDIDSVINQYLTTVKPMHNLHVEPTKKYADVIIDNGDSVDPRKYAVLHIADYIYRIYGGYLR